MANRRIMGGRPASYVDALRGKQIEAAVQAGRQGVDIEIAGAVCRPDRDTERDARKVTQRDPFGREKSTFAEPNEKEWALGGPLSDGGQSIKDAAYEQYQGELVNAWRRR